MASDGGLSAASVSASSTTSAVATTTSGTVRIRRSEEGVNRRHASIGPDRR